MQDLRSRPVWTDLAYLVPLALFFLLYGLGRGSLASWDEAIYASVAKDVVRTGQWLRLTIGGEPWFDKPPLTIWATALAYKLFGIHEFSARLFSALCGVGAVVVTYLLGLRLFGRWTGLLGALVLLNSSHYLRFMRFGMTDGPLVLFLTLSLYWFWRGSERNRYLIFSGVALGLALLTKGFAAFFIFPVILLYCLLARDFSPLGRSSYWVGLMIAVLIALPWNLYEMTAHRGAFIDNVVVKHLFVRTLQPIEGHDGNWYFYIRTFINKYHPWVLIGIFSAPYFLWKALRRRDEAVAFTAAWIFAIFAVITLVRTKLPWYILPLYPAVSISVGYLLSRWIDERRRALVMALFVGAMWLHVPLSHLAEADYSADLKAIAPEVAARVSPGTKIYLYNFHEEPAAIFYWGRPIRYADDPKAFDEAARASGAGFWAFARERDLAALAAAMKTHDLRVVASAREGRLVARKERTP